MNSADWKEAWRLFQQTRDLSPAERAARLSEVPSHISAEVEAMAGSANAPDPEAPSPGDEYGRYTLIEQLGSGGMGDVFSARDRELGRLVAIKFLGARALLLPSARERLIREAQAASQLNHPYLVTVHEVLTLGSGVALVTELVNGKSLREFGGAGRPMPQVAAWGAQIARALAAAHAESIVHSDIKPENIMLRGDGYIKILDFGLVQNIGFAGGLQDIPLGTIGYMSPEQTRNEPLTGASDVFSLGVTLMELITGKHPFLAGTRSATTVAITQKPVEYAAPRIAGGNEFAVLIRKMLEKDAALRPSMSEVAARLELIAASNAPRRWYWIAGACAAVVVGVTAWFGARPKSPGFSAPTAITDYSGLESQPAFSADGRAVAFVWSGPDGSQDDIYIRAANAVDGAPRRVTNDRNEEFSPAWSPDGKYLAWRRRPFDGGDGELRVAAVNGLDPGPSRVVATTANDGGFHGLAWSPDSQSLIARDKSEQGFSLFLIRVTDGTKTQITSEPGMQDYQPVISPDGRRLLFLRYKLSHPQVCYAEPGPALLKPVCREFRVGLGAATWTLDSRAILYNTDETLLLIPAGDNASAPITKVQDGIFTNLATDAAGKRYAFDRTVIDSNIVRFDVAAQQTSPLISSSSEESEPQFSPDGTRILFRSSRTGHFELYTSNPDGSDLRQLTHLASHCGSARWSPDGRWIAYDSVQDFPGPDGVKKWDNIYVMPAAGGPARRLTDDGADSIVPNWSADGRWVYYTRPQQTWKVSREGGPPVQVADFEMFGAMESADGRWIWYERRTAPKGLWRRLVAGGAEEPIPGTENLTYRTWELRGKRLVFLRSVMNPGFWAMDVEHGTISRPRLMGPPPRKLLFGPATMSASPDGNTILYTSEDVSIGDIYVFGPADAGVRK